MCSGWLLAVLVGDPGQGAVLGAGREAIRRAKGAVVIAGCLFGDVVQVLVRVCLVRSRCGGS